MSMPPNNVPVRVNNGVTPQFFGNDLNVNTVYALNVASRSIAGIGAQFNISNARSTIADNLGSSLASVLNYTFIQATTGTTSLTGTVPSEVQAINATNITGDTYQGLLNSVRTADTWTSLGQSYKNIVINLGSALVRNLVDLGQATGANAYLQTAAGLSVISRYAADNPTGPLYPFTEFVNSLQTGFDQISQRNYTGAKATIDAAYATFVSTGLPAVVQRLRVAPNLLNSTGGLGLYTNAQLNYLSGLITRASAGTQSNLTALYDLALQTTPVGPLGPTTV